MQYLHELRAGGTLPEEDAITFWSRWQAAYACPTGPHLLAAPASQAYVERVFSVCRWLTAGRRNRLSKNLEIHRVSKKQAKLFLL